MSRPHIPVALERRLKEESGYRCAIPTCRSTSLLEMAHIIPRSEVHEDTFDNMIVLCAMCHGLYDREKKIPRKSIVNFKANLGLLNARYSQSELRVLEYFSDDSEDDVLITSMDPMFFSELINDGHLTCAPGGGLSFMHVINGKDYETPMTWVYTITETGRVLVDQMSTGESID